MASSNSLAVCTTCNSNLAVDQKDCCFRECQWFRDKAFHPVAGDCTCSSDVPKKAVGGILSILQRNQPACPHKMSTATLPAFLGFKSYNGKPSVITKVKLGVKSVFGPLLAPIVLGNSAEECSPCYPHGNLRVGCQYLFHYLGSDLDCNWMKHVIFVDGDTNKANLRAFKFNDQIYFVTVKEVCVGEELRVAYADNYPLPSKETPSSSDPSNADPSPEIITISDSEDEIPVITSRPKRKRAPPANTSGVPGKSRKKAVKLSALLKRKARNPSEETTATSTQSVPSEEPPFIDSSQMMAEAATSMPSESVMQDPESERTNLYQESLLDDTGVDFAQADSPMLSSTFEAVVDQEPSMNPSSSSALLNLNESSAGKSVHDIPESSKAGGEDDDPYAGLTYSQRMVLKRGYRYRCAYCKSFFGSNTSIMDRHKKTCAQAPAVLPPPTKYKCHFCQDEFARWELKKHLETHQIDGLFHCTTCPETFSDWKKCKIHLYCHRKRIERKLLKILPENAPLTEPKVNQKREWKVCVCNVCQHRCASERQLEIHRSKHFPPSVPCPHCVELFHHEVDLNTHRKDVHGELQKRRAPRNFSTKSNPVMDEYDSYIFKCDTCRIGFTVRQSLVDHLDSLHPEINKSNIHALNLPIRKWTAYTCCICKGHFMDEEQAKAHCDTKHTQKDLKRVRSSNGKLQNVGYDLYGGFLRSYEAEVYFCELCLEKFEPVKSFLHHCQTEHRDYYNSLMPDNP